LWNYSCGPFPIAVEALDMDGDGTDEVVVGTAAVANGVEDANGISDSDCYFFAFDAKGKLLWRHRLGGVYARGFPIVEDTDHDGKRDLLGWTTSAPEVWLQGIHDEPCAVVRLNQDGLDTHRYNAPVTIQSCRVGDIDSNGTNEVLVADRDGFLVVLDQNLNEVRRERIINKRFTYVNPLIAGVGRVRGDALPDIVVLESQIDYVAGMNVGDPKGDQNVRVPHDVKVLLYDSTLKLRGEFLIYKKWMDFLAPKCHLWDTDGDNRLEIVVIGPHVVVLDWVDRLHAAY
ncbi:MAG: hypothetical protein N3G20_10300, partial [Verrucomicrobiae bacterium]|nr:hypothetical protein [Verrucomicrobiae bacterium]